jgi:FkbM family methyltransferase
MQTSDIFNSKSENDDKAIRLLERLAAQLEELTLVSRFQALGEEKVLEFVHSDKNLHFFLPYAAKDFIQRVILKTHSFYENVDLEKFRDLVPPEAIIIDAGANIGNHSVFFSVICGAKKIYAFEPMNQTFEILRRNAALNAPDRIECINAALGEADGRADLLGYRAHNFGAARVAVSTDGLYRVTNIDGLGLTHLDIIKIDVEGSQALVIEGARQTLLRCSPRIWMERNPAGEAKLTSLGYAKTFEISKNNFVWEK